MNDRKKADIRREWEMKDIIRWGRKRRRTWNDHMDKMARVRQAKIARAATAVRKKSKQMERVMDINISRKPIIWIYKAYNTWKKMKKIERHINVFLPGFAFCYFMVNLVNYLLAIEVSIKRYLQNVVSLCTTNI